MLHASTVWCNGAMNAFTTNDAFLRDNLTWTASATNWNRFSATSSLGMIHMGNKQEAMKMKKVTDKGGNQKLALFAVLTIIKQRIVMPSGHDKHHIKLYVLGHSAKGIFPATKVRHSEPRGAAQ